MNSTTTGGIKVATELAQNQFVFGILFILLLVAVLWGVKVRIERMEKEQTEMADKNDGVVEKMENLHLERQQQLYSMMVENKQESKEREAQLMSHNNTLLIQLQSQNSSLEEITRTQASMQNTQEKMQESLSYLQDNVYDVRSRLEKVEKKQN